MSDKPCWVKLYRQAGRKVPDERYRGASREEYALTGWLPATFHAWGVESSEPGAMNTVAIVEVHDTGEVSMATPEHVRFKPPAPEQPGSP